MDVVNSYFGDLVFVLVEHKEKYTVYAACLGSSFADNKKQYILGFVPIHLAILQKAYLRELMWHSIQTRTLSQDYKIPPQRWVMPRDLPNFVFSVKERNDGSTIYSDDNEVGLDLLLLHDTRKKTRFQYNNNTNLITALNSFNCVLSLRS